MEELNTGAKRSKEYSHTVDSKFPPRYDLLPIEGLRRWAEAFGEGSLKYGDGNFRKGFTDSCLMQHALTHLFLYQAGDTTEDHLGHAMWNIGMLCKMEKERPELMLLKKAIAHEYDERERPTYATDDPRLTVNGCNVASAPSEGIEEGIQSEPTAASVYIKGMSRREDLLRADLERCRATFFMYGQMHEAKGNLEKAEANFKLAIGIGQTLKA